MKVKFTGISEENKIVKEKIMKSISSLIDKGDFILGKSVHNFEKSFAKYVGSKYAVGVNSGSDALTLSLKAIGISNGDEIITCPNSYIATSWAIVAASGKPVFVDCDDSMNIDWRQIESKITKKTKAIVPTHLTGLPCEIEKIEKIASKYKIPVIYDCAQAVGSEYKQKMIGGFSFISCFSLHPLKNLAVAGDGGVVTTNNSKIYETLKMLRNHGSKNRDVVNLWGYNSRLDNIQSEIANIKIKKLNSWLTHIRKIAKRYSENLYDIVEVPKEIISKNSSFHLYIIKVKNKSERLKLMNYLSKKNIETKIHYPIPIHLQPCSKNLNYKKGDFPNTESFCERIISLPIYSNLTIDKVNYVIKSIRNFYKR